MLLNIIRIRQNNSDSAGLGSGRIWIDQYETKFEYLPELVSHVTDTLLAPCYWHPPCAMFRTSSLRHVTDSLPALCYGLPPCAMLRTPSLSQVTDYLPAPCYGHPPCAMLRTPSLCMASAWRSQILNWVFCFPRICCLWLSCPWHAAGCRPCQLFYQSWLESYSM